MTAPKISVCGLRPARPRTAYSGRRNVDGSGWMGGCSLATERVLGGPAPQDPTTTHGHTNRGWRLLAQVGRWDGCKLTASWSSWSDRTQISGEPPTTTVSATTPSQERFRQSWTRF